MKRLFVIIILLFLQIESYCQAEERNNCCDTTRYQIKSNLPYFPELNIKINGDWRTFELMDGIVGRFDYECKEIELNEKNSKDLVIRWENAVYGTGGGSTTKGIQIWNLENAKKILDEITYCSEENFGRSGNGYFIFCEKKIEIEGRTIKVYEKKCTTERSTKNYKLPSPMDYCNLSKIKPSNYILKNGQLEKE